ALHRATGRPAVPIRPHHARLDARGPDRRRRRRALGSGGRECTDPGRHRPLLRGPAAAPAGPVSAGVRLPRRRTPWGFSPMDVWPARREVFLTAGDPYALLAAITDRAITRLLLPEGGPDPADTAGTGAEAGNPGWVARVASG